MKYARAYLVASRSNKSAPTRLEVHLEKCEFFQHNREMIGKSRRLVIICSFDWLENLQKNKRNLKRFNRSTEAHRMIETENMTQTSGLQINYTAKNLFHILISKRVRLQLFTKHSPLFGLIHAQDSSGALEKSRSSMLEKRDDNS